MNGIRIKTADAQKVRQYELLTNSMVDVIGGRWHVDIPEENIWFNSTGELMEFINGELGYIQEAYENNGEMDDWRAIEAESARQQKKSYAERKAERLGKPVV